MQKDSDIKSYKNEVGKITQKYFPFLDKDGVLQKDILAFAVKARNAHIFFEIMCKSIFDYEESLKAWKAGQLKNYPDKAELVARLARAKNISLKGVSQNVKS